MTKTKAFQFPKARKAARPKVDFAKAAPVAQDPAQMLIKGQPAGSKEEYYTATALDVMGLQYSYQVPMAGGRSRRGGQMLDFVVYTPGKTTVVDVRGVYWHTGRHEDSLDIERVMQNKGWNLLVAWDYNVPTQADALSFLRAHLPNG